MNKWFPTKKIVVWALCLSLLLGAAGPAFLTPELEAASQASLTRLVKKLKRQIKKLKRQLAIARRQPPPHVPPTFMEMVTVGNAGNMPDSTTYGAVDYEFQIGKYEVNLEQYTAFLNAVAATDTYGLYHSQMATRLNIAGIEQIGNLEPFTYAVIGSGKRPVTYVSWFDAARFCNWLHNDRPTGGQDATTTERGAYTLDGANTNEIITRNPGAKVWIPREDEWYKAAYHDPRDGVPGGPAGDDHYWLYPTMSDDIPGNVIGTTANQANFKDVSGFSVTQSVIYNANQNYLTDGGTYGGNSSFYGTYDQCGNVWEWSDAIIDSSDRVLRGGSWNISESSLRSSTRRTLNQDNDDSGIGFRVVSF